MEIFFFLLIFIFIISMAVFVIQIPIMIAKNRGITGDNLNIIQILSWLGIFMGITWFVALTLSLVWKSSLSISINNDDKNNFSYLDALDKLNALKEKGIITEEEFKIEKEKIINSNK